MFHVKQQYLTETLWLYDVPRETVCIADNCAFTTVYLPLCIYTVICLLQESNNSRHQYPSDLVRI